ncbi:MAG: SDR family oxidoreductase [Chthoniobacteraceae bacterium]
MRRVVVAGCGFVGLATARRLHHAGWEVLGCTHTEESARALATEPFAASAADLTNVSSLSALDRWRECDAVIHCASSGRGGADAYRSVYLQGARNILEALAPQRLLFTSSTSVYAQNGGEWVTEDSPAEPDRETGRVLRETEELVLTSGGCVARLAGIYGPGRSVLLKKFFFGEAVIEGDGGRWINQVHRDDIATALTLLVESGATGIFNVSDDTPMTQRDIYEWLATHFCRPLPPSGPVDTNRKRGVTSKRVNNARLRALGWAPKYPSFRDAVMSDRELISALDR